MRQHDECVGENRGDNPPILTNTTLSTLDFDPTTSDVNALPAEIQPDHMINRVYLGVHSLHDNLHDEPTFQELLAKLKL